MQSRRKCFGWLHHQLSRRAGHSAASVEIAATRTAMQIREGELRTWFIFMDSPAFSANSPSLRPAAGPGVPPWIESFGIFSCSSGRGKSSVEKNKRDAKVNRSLLTPTVPAWPCTFYFSTVTVTTSALALSKTRKVSPSEPGNAPSSQFLYASFSAAFGDDLSARQADFHRSLWIIRPNHPADAAGRRVHYQFWSPTWQ